LKEGKGRNEEIITQREESDVIEGKRKKEEKRREEKRREEKMPEYIYNSSWFGISPSPPAPGNPPGPPAPP